MRKIRKLAALLVCAAMVMAVLPGSALAETEGVTADGLEYQVYDDHVEITGYTGNAAELEIPGEIDELPVTVIGGHAFVSCHNLTSLTIPDSVTIIGDYAFYSCDSLTGVTIPNSVTAIGREAFEYCHNLTSLTIPGSVTAIGGSAFHGCTGLTSVTIPDNVTSVGSGAFYGTGIYNDDNNWVDDVLYIDNHLIEARNSITGDYAIKQGTLTIADSAFDSCHSLTGVTIPDSVTVIGNYAFYFCYSLTSVTIPDSVTAIGREAFSYCSGLTCIDVAQDNPSYLGQDGVLFDKAMTTLIRYPAGNSRTSYEIPDGVTSIGDYAFYDCTNLTSVTVPGSVTSINGYPFYNCNGLTSISVVPENPSYVDINGVLFDKTMTKLVKYPADNIRTSYEIPDGVTSIGGYAFEYCHNLTGVTIPDSVTDIGYGAFIACISLTKVTISDSVTSIGERAFFECHSLKSVTIPGTSIGNYAFSGCTGLTSVIIHDSVTTIGDYAFYGCTGLTGVTIPDSVTSIGGHAFEYCHNLTSVTIPGSVTAIGGFAFSGCDSLTDVYYDGSEEDLKKLVRSMFPADSSLKNATIHYNASMPETTPAPEIKVTVNGAPIEFDVPPMAIDGTTMLPVRLALEPLGAEFVWDGENQTVTVTARGKTIVLTIGSATALVDGEEKTMARPAMATDGRTLIPIRFVSEELGYNVDWDGETSTVIING